MNRMRSKKQLKRPHKYSYFFNIPFLFFTMLVLITLSTLYLSSFGFREGVYTGYLTNYRLLGLNAWPIAATLLLFFALFGRVRLAIYLSFVFWHLIALLELLKINFRHESLKLYDYDLFGAAFQMGRRYLGAKLWFGLLGVSVICLVLIFVIRLLPPLRLSRTGRAVCLMMALAGSYLLSGVYFSVDTAGNLGTKTLSPFTEPDGAMRNGYAYSLFFESQAGFPKKEPKKAAEGKALAEQYPEKPLVADGKPKVNVCVMLLEAYKDISDSDMKMKLNRNPYDAFHALEDSGMSGHFLADVYGGGTMHSEMAVLTGFDRHTPPGHYRHPHQSYVRTFYDNGYTTEAMHPYRGYFYNRAGFYPQLGFQRFFYEENYFHRDTIKEGILPDSTLFQHVLKRVTEQSKKGPYFNYTATMQNHGPYYGEQLYAKPFFDKPEGMSDEDYNIINNYLGGVEGTSQALVTLLEGFEALEEPVLFICFGDHSPGLTEGVYRALGMESDVNTSQGYMNRYATPYLVWGNSACKKALGKALVGTLPATDPQLLMAQVFHFLDWGGTPYQQFLAQTAEQVSAQKPNFVIEAGKKNPTASATASEILEKRAALELYSKNIKLSPIEVADQ